MFGFDPEGTEGSGSQRPGRALPARVLGVGSPIVAVAVGTAMGQWVVGLAVAAALALPVVLVIATSAAIALRQDEPVADRVKLIKALAELVKVK